MVHVLMMTLVLLAILFIVTEQGASRAGALLPGCLLAGRVGSMIKDFARLLSRSLSPSLIGAAWRMRSSIAASNIGIMILIEDRARRRRRRHRLRTVLGICIAVMGPPACQCTVVLVRCVERNGRFLAACVERLSYPDGTSRLTISIPLEEDGQIVPFDVVAARVAHHFPVVTSAKLDVIIADESVVAAPTVFQDARVTLSQRTNLMPEPPITRLETLSRDNVSRSAERR